MADKYDPAEFYRNNSELDELISNILDPANGPFAVAASENWMHIAKTPPAKTADIESPSIWPSTTDEEIVKEADKNFPLNRKSFRPKLS
jgi:hypothetical protein